MAGSWRSNLVWLVAGRRTARARRLLVLALLSSAVLLGLCIRSDHAHGLIWQAVASSGRSAHGSWRVLVTRAATAAPGVAPQTPDELPRGDHRAASGLNGTAAETAQCRALRVVRSAWREPPDLIIFLRRWRI